MWSCQWYLHTCTLVPKFELSNCWVCIISTVPSAQCVQLAMRKCHIFRCSTIKWIGVALFRSYSYICQLLISFHWFGNHIFIGEQSALSFIIMFTTRFNQFSIKIQTTIRIYIRNCLVTESMSQSNWNYGIRITGFYYSHKLSINYDMVKQLHIYRVGTVINLPNFCFVCFPHFGCSEQFQWIRVYHFSCRSTQYGSLFVHRIEWNSTIC